VTIARRGLIDHSDSLGAAARFGRGDVQWLTAGSGIVHSEMFPLLEASSPNPVELFQIWLNLPHADKLVAPHFTMLWDREAPRVTAGGAEVTVIAGKLADARPGAPPPHSWASRADSDVAIWSIKLAAGATWTVPPTLATSNRALYFFRGGSVRIGARTLTAHAGVQLAPDVAVEVAGGEGEVELLLLQGRPIGEPVAQYGPFVMTTPREIEQAFLDYRKTQFGGWPWPSDDPVHARGDGRFARHADGKIERP
jgi:quercetin 2,3-dioxygenase